ncbi:S-formylglutathione hydrolase [bacterium K02(2017)]|nr:S-formylglutathione hydrolase [bacterium K02(2017)]
MLKLTKKNKSFSGWTEFYEHPSECCPETMRFSIYRPPQAENQDVPILYWLSGLTCSEENVMAKSGIQEQAAKHGIMIVAPDTSPRGANIEGEDDAWDFGSGAGFYLNATEPKWSKHYNMYDYVLKELPEIINQNFPVQNNNKSISGHSMGGHGALTIALKNLDEFKSCSAFAPICAPTLCPWGQKAFKNYLGDDVQSWQDYDAHLLMLKTQGQVPILIDQGSSDEFLTEQLLPQKLIEAAKSREFSLDYREQVGYDHSYYFIASFMADHLAFHAKYLK